MYSNNYANVANAINVFDCTVLVVAQQFAQALNEFDRYDNKVATVCNKLRKALKKDEFKNDAACFANKKLRKACKLYKDEQHDDAHYALCAAMMQRSAAIEKACY
jgi:Mn-containing catalase